MEFVKPKKHLGQHFLKDEQIAGDIARSLEDSHTENVLEVGPGTGVLTKYLIADPRIKNFFAAEVDTESVAYLKRHLKLSEEQVKETDFLKMPLDDLFRGTDFGLIGNFPYNISSQIYFRVLENRNRITQVVGMIQKEVAERIASKEGRKAYGILSVLLQAYYECEYLFTVPPDVFIPPPKVESAVLRLTRKTQEEPWNHALLHKVVKMAFNQRRKTMRNSLKGLPLPESMRSDEIFSKRPEQLSWQTFTDLVKELEKNGVN